MRASKKQTGTQVKKTKNKRVSLRCPLSIERTDLEYNYDSSALQVCMTVENMGGGGLASDTIESAVIVVRLYDGDKKIIACRENEYFAKLLRFGEEGLAGGARITFRLLPDCEGGVRAEDTEIYISRIRYTDGTVTDYVRGDFFDLPGEGVLLTKKFKKDPDAAIEALGEGALYLPEHLTEIVWRCTCGEFSESDTCPTCNRNKGELFTALDALIAPKNAKKTAAAPLRPLPDELNADSSAAEGTSLPASDQTAEYSTAAAKAALAAMEAENGTGNADEEDGNAIVPPTRDREKEQPDKIKTILLISISAASVILFTIILLLILTLCGNREPADTTTEPAGTNLPADDTGAAEKIVRSYLAQNDFDNALGYATLSNCPQTLIDEIYNTAIQYYTAANQLDNALEWATKKGDSAMIATINVLRFTEKLNNKDYLGAMELVDSLPADRQEDARAQASEGYVADLVAAGKYEEAMAAADQYNTATTSAQIAEMAIQNYLDAKDFDSAIQLAQEKNLPAQVIAAASAATDYYVQQGDYDNAADYVGLTGNADQMSAVLENLTDVQLRRHLPTFFSLLTVAQKQAVHASVISAKPQTVAAIDDAGNVYLGEQLIYSAASTIDSIDPITGEVTTTTIVNPAVSVSCCDTVVVVLLSDGTVRIAEGTNHSYSQADIAQWTDIVAIAAGNYHLLGLTKDGTVVAVGSNLNGQCDTAAIQNAVSIAVGDNHSLILHADGTVTALGNNIAGICNTDGWSDVIAIAAGTLHSIGLKADGTVVALGNCDVTGWNDVVAIFSTATRAVAIKSDGTLLYSVSGKSSDVLSEVTDALWVGVGKQAVVVLHKDGNLSVPGEIILDLPLSWKTEAFGIANNTQ